MGFAKSCENCYININCLDIKWELWYYFITKIPAFCGRDMNFN